MRPLTRPAGLNEIEAQINISSSIEKILSYDVPENIHQLRILKAELLTELAAYDTEMRSNRCLSYNSRINFIKYKDTFEWLYNNPSIKRKTIYIKKIRDLYVENGIKCPYCGVNPCRTLDHYYNKALLPQYAILSQNLIPCCGDCNKDKGTLKAFKKWRRIINPYYDNYHDSLQNEPIVKIIFKDKAILGLEPTYVIAPSDNLSKKAKKHITYHLKKIKIEKLHQESIFNSFWRNARTLRGYNSLLEENHITQQTYDTLVHDLIRKNELLAYDWEYIVRYSLVKLSCNHWIYESNLPKLR